MAEILSDSRRVLDAACGAGAGTALLARSGASVVGVDLSPAAIAAARERHGDVAEFREGDLRELPFRDGEFDAVTCFEAIVQLPDVEPALDELRRLLRAGGTLFVSAPNRDVYPSGNPLHLSELSPTELEELLRARFANVAIHRQQTYFASLLGDADAPAQDDPAVLLDVSVTKAAGGPVGRELHAVAAASDGELPPAPALLTLGEDAGFTERESELRKWRERAVQAEAEALALRKQLRGRQG